MENAIEQDQQTRAKAEQDADPRIDLAAERTSYAMERTQLAWVRTVMGFITAGLAIDKGTEALHEARVVAGIAWSKNGHFAGMLLTITATALMIVATMIYIRRMKQLNRMRGTRTDLPAPTTVLSIFVCFLGALAIYFLRIPW
jgi:inner membrane protein YidH